MKRIIQNDNYQEFLLRFQGAFAQIWLFDVTHKKLIIRLTKPQNSQEASIKEALYILGISCEYISGPFSWSNSSLDIKQKVDGETKQTVFLIEDETIGFILKTIGGVGLAIGPESEIDYSFDNFLRD